MISIPLQCWEGVAQLCGACQLPLSACWCAEFLRSCKMVLLGSLMSRGQQAFNSCLILYNLVSCVTEDLDSTLNASNLSFYHFYLTIFDFCLTKYRH